MVFRVDEYFIFLIWISDRPVRARVRFWASLICKAVYAVSEGSSARSDVEAPPSAAALGKCRRWLRAIGILKPKLSFTATDGSPSLEMLLGDRAIMAKELQRVEATSRHSVYGPDDAIDFPASFEATPDCV